MCNKPFSRFDGGNFIKSIPSFSQIDPLICLHKVWFYALPLCQKNAEVKLSPGMTLFGSFPIPFSSFNIVLLKSQLTVLIVHAKTKLGLGIAGFCILDAALYPRASTYCHF